MNRERLIHWYYYISITLIIIFGCILFFYKYIDGEYYNPVLTFKSNIAETDKSEYKSGDLVSVYWNFCKHRDLVSRINISMLDDIVIVIPEVKQSLPVGCYEGKSVFQIKIPQIVHTGDFTTHVSLTYKVNPMRTIVYQLESKAFKVIK